MATGSGNEGVNERRLRGEDMIRVPGKDLKRPYRAFIEGLTPEEVDVLIAVKKRLEEAERVARTPPGPDGLPGYVHVMIPP
jgi:hypothetical protein